MKKTLLTIKLIYLFVLAQAQPALFSSEMLPFGSAMTQKSVMDLNVIDTTIQGAGATWDFTALTNNTSNPDLVVNIVDPATTPYASSFPNSNYGYKEVKGTSINYRYFNLSSTKMERVGSYVTNINIYNDPQVEYVFPLTLGTVNYDTWDNTGSTFGGTYDLACIGTGTLILPGGTYNALMVRVHFVESYLNFYVYYWYSSDNGAVLITNIVGDGTYVASSGRYLGGLSINIEGKEFMTDIKYNNPIENKFTFSFQPQSNGAYSYSILNSLGQIIFSRNIESLSGNRETFEIDFSNYAPGIYFFSLLAVDSKQKNKTILILKN